MEAIETSTNLLDCRAINLCTGIETSIENLAKKIAKFTNFKGDIHWSILTRPTEIYRLCGDWNMAFNKLVWRPQVELDEGLILTIKNIQKAYEL